MKKLIKDIVLAAAIGFAVGALVSFAAPAIATLAGLETAGAMANPIFMGLFASAWGAFGAAAAPLINGIVDAFTRKKPVIVQDINASSPVHTVEQVRETDMLSNGKFAQMIEAEKARAVELSR